MRWPGQLSGSRSRQSRHCQTAGPSLPETAPASGWATLA
ncbi:hypothetical protein CEXT_117801, partial [Caerostris extrusa]